MKHARDELAPKIGDPWRRGPRHSVGLLVIAALVCIGPLVFQASLASAAQEYGFVRAWGSKGHGDGKFDWPESLAIGPSGNVYVTDHFNGNSIQEFTPAGAFITSWGGGGVGNGKFYDPTSVTTDAAGNVYVTDDSFFSDDFSHDRVQKFTAAGTFLTKWGSRGSANGQFQGPVGVATDGAGNVYVADAGNNRIQKFTSTGAFITKWGSKGSGNGQFHSPLDVATDAAGHVYVADSLNHRIEKFSSSGAFITKWESPLSGRKKFYPSGIATDAAGNVFATDEDNYRIQVFSPTGKFLTTWGSQGNGEGQFYFPADVATDAAGNVYVADHYNNRIQEFAPLPPPKTGKTVNAKPVSGTVLVRPKGKKHYVRLTGNTQIPVGSTVDTTKGKVELTSTKNRSGSKTQHGDFSKGKFKVSQTKGKKPYTRLRLLGSLSRCGTSGKLQGHGHGHKHHKPPRLYGSGHGRFRVKGHHGSGSGNGKSQLRPRQRPAMASTGGGKTVWLTEERCNGTFFRDYHGRLKVRDFTLNRTIILHAGQHYMAKAP